MTSSRMPALETRIPALDTRIRELKFLPAPAPAIRHGPKTVPEPAIRGYCMPVGDGEQLLQGGRFKGGKGDPEASRSTRRWRGKPVRSRGTGHQGSAAVGAGARCRVRLLLPDP